MNCRPAALGILMWPVYNTPPPLSVQPTFPTATLLPSAVKFPAISVVVGFPPDRREFPVNSVAFLASLRVFPVQPMVFPVV